MQPMTTTAAPVPSTSSSSLWRGVGVGVLLGAAVWVVYFVQASVVDWFSWWTSVVPALAVAVVGAVAVALLRPQRRAAALGVALGAAVTLPLVLGAFVVLATALNLE